MPLYPNYSMTNYMYQQPIQNPYMPQMPMQNIGLNGRIVDDFNSITANDVPMDNFGAIFVKADGTEVQRKVWDKNGRIITVPFKAVTGGFDSQPNNLSEAANNFDMKAFNEVVDGLNSKIDKLSERIDAMLKPKGKVTTND